MNHPEFQAARLTVRLGAVVSNYRLCQRLAGPAAVAGVVKADAYGLGAAAVTKALAGAGEKFRKICEVAAIGIERIVAGALFRRQHVEEQIDQSGV